MMQKEKQKLNNFLNTNQKNTINVLLAGNPNCGKTTLFNRLTGSRQYVGNRVGVTVEVKKGRVHNSLNKNIEITDLPGIYSLSPYTMEETVAKNCIAKNKSSIMLNIVDATNLERNLFLTSQLAQLHMPMIIALNMCDIIEKEGEVIDTAYLEKIFMCPVVPISAGKNKGIDKLIKKIIELGNNSLINTPKTSDNNSIWSNHNKTADMRFDFIHNVSQNAITKKSNKTYLTSDKIDRFLLNKKFAAVIFLFIILLIFAVTFGPPGTFLRKGAAFVIDDVFGNSVHSILDAFNVSEWVQSLVIDGIITGVGSVISFLPQIVILFTLLSLLEDSGYMARAAFIMDRPMRCIGLSGNAFIPLLMGFGCTVPAILSTRTLENSRDKKLSILIMPFMSCSAKMPVYLMFCSYFFADSSPFVIFLLYITGIMFGIMTALLFNGSKGKEKKISPFVLELPPYRIPTPKNLLYHIWDRTSDFLARAGTTLLVASVIIWFLQRFNFAFQSVDTDQSILACLGRFIAPVFSMCGFGDWRTAVSLTVGIAAKESIVSTLSVLYGTCGIGSAFTCLSAFSFLVFVVLYPPCIASLCTIYKETESIKQTAFTIIYQFLAALFASAFVFQIGTLFFNLFCR